MSRVWNSLEDSSREGREEGVQRSRNERRKRSGRRRICESRDRQEREEEEVSRVRISRRRLLLALLCAALSFFTARSIFGDRGLLEVATQESELVRIQREVEAARARNRALLAEVVELRTGNASIERLARERLGYIKPGEVTYLFPEESSDPPQAFNPSR